MVIEQENALLIFFCWYLLILTDKNFKSPVDIYKGYLGFCSVIL